MTYKGGVYVRFRVNAATKLISLAKSERSYKATVIFAETRSVAMAV